MLSDKIRDQIDEAFEFIGYVNKYRKNGVKFDLGGDRRFNISVSYRADGSSRVTDLNPKKEVVETKQLEPFYKMRWKEQSILFTELDFIDDELSYLGKFSDAIKADYRYTFHPLVKMFKEKKEELMAKKQKSTVDTDTLLEALRAKNLIAAKLIGLIGNHNSSKTVQPVFYYIDDVLSDHKITPIEAKAILLKMQGSFSPEWNKNVTPYILHHLDQISTLEIPKLNNGKKIAAKFYALYHWVLIEMGTEKPFEKNENDNFKANEIVSFAEERYKFDDGQGFYRAFIDIDITNKTMIANSFKKGYKAKLIAISGNDAKIITHLKNWPN